MMIVLPMLKKSKQVTDVSVVIKRQGHLYMKV